MPASTSVPFPANTTCRFRPSVTIIQTLLTRPKGETMPSQLRFPAPPLPSGARPSAGQRRARRALAPWALATAVLTGQVMASLDAAIVNVAGPAIQRDLHLSGAALQLAIYSYLLVYTVAVVTGARLGGRYGF